MTTAASRRFKGVVRSVKKATPRLSLSKEETEAAIAVTEYQEARSAARTLDREKTQMQSDGFVQAFGLSVADAAEIMADLGIDPREVIYSSGYLVLKGVGHDAVTR